MTVEDWRLSEHQQDQIIDDLNDSKEMNEKNELNLIENNGSVGLNEEAEYVIKDELSEDEKVKENEWNSDSELKD